MSRKKILWLCSWYPGRTDPFNGDFIQRHARAAALYNDIQVIHVLTIPSQEYNLQTNIDKTDSGTLSEKIIYIKSSAGFLGRLVSNYKLVRAYKNAVRQYVIEQGRPDLLHVHVPMKAGIAGIWARKNYGLPMLVTEHWGIYNSIVADNFFQRSYIFRTLTKKILHAANGFISVSQFLVGQIKKIMPLGKSFIIPNTVNTTLFNYAHSQEKIFRFIHVSNMVPLKNVEGILRAFKKLSRVHPFELVLVGNRDNSLEKFAADNELQEHVSFRGEIPYEEVAIEMRKSNCLLLFSNIENSPCVIGEALCCGLPVIATAVGGIPELVDQRNGLLVEPGNEDALTAVMEKMIRGISDYDRQQISADAIEKFSYESVGKKFDEVYNSVLKRRIN